ncbi:hypothetical protein VTN49DRAFT_4562 [Thermomyces lanuginosus]|uniref:uncharacterized protein n=1 Tax=Thermomyces lanuginosus TaxID=5541 RepID=UPI0037436297
MRAPRGEIDGLITCCFDKDGAPGKTNFLLLYLGIHRIRKALRTASYSIIISAYICKRDRQAATTNIFAGMCVYIQRKIQNVY